MLVLNSNHNLGDILERYAHAGPGVPSFRNYIRAAYPYRWAGISSIHTRSNKQGSLPFETIYIRYEHAYSNHYSCRTLMPPPRGRALDIDIWNATLLRDEYVTSSTVREVRSGALLTSPSTSLVLFGHYEHPSVHVNLSSGSTVLIQVTATTTTTTITAAADGWSAIRWRTEQSVDGGKEIPTGGLHRRLQEVGIQRLCSLEMTTAAAYH